MEPGADTVYVAWRLRRRRAEVAARCHAFSPTAATITARPGPTGFNPEIAAAGARLTRRGAGPLRVDASPQHRRARSRRGATGTENFDLPVERERGLGDRDAHLHVGDGTVPLEPGKWVGLCAGLASARWRPISTPRSRAAAPGTARCSTRRSPPIRSSPTAPDWVMRLVLATDASCVARPLPDVPDGRSVIAGYPWFGDWGRDTMISLPGLCLATGRFDEARHDPRHLRAFCRWRDAAQRLPRAPATGPTTTRSTPTLWYIEAWRAYVEATGDEAALREVFPAPRRRSSTAHQRGTRYGIGVDPADGLLRAGEPGVQLTWMDAQGRRLGRHAAHRQAGRDQRALVQRAGRDGGDGRADRRGRRRLSRGRRRARKPGSPASSCPTGSGLYDVIDGPDGNDASLRPNQIFAVSLSATPARSGDAARRARRLRRPLVTLVRAALAGAGSTRPIAAHITGGVAAARRRLSPGHGLGLAARAMGACALPRPRRRGGGASAARRDRRGICAMPGSARSARSSTPTRRTRPRGCPAQAWSVACVLEAWWRLEHARNSTGRRRPARSLHSRVATPAVQATAPSARRPPRAPRRS